MDIGNRNIKIEPSEYRGRWYVSIREWYEQDGELKPGRKGINLSIEEWNEIVDKFDELKAEIEKAQK